MVDSRLAGAGEVDDGGIGSKGCTVDRGGGGRAGRMCQYVVQFSAVPDM